MMSTSPYVTPKWACSQYPSVKRCKAAGCADLVQEHLDPGRKRMVCRAACGENRIPGNLPACPRGRQFREGV